MSWKYLNKCMVLAVIFCTSVLPARAQDHTINDEEVKLVSFVDLEYPPLARAARIEGVVVVKITLNEEGETINATALSGPRALITDTLSNARKWKFKPNTQRSALIVYNFKLEEGGCHDNTRSLFLLEHFNFASIKSCTPVVK